MDFGFRAQGFGESLAGFKLRKLDTGRLSKGLKGCSISVADWGEIQNHRPSTLNPKPLTQKNAA